MSLLETTLYLPVWANDTVAMVSRYSRERRRAELRLDARPTAAIVFHRQRQPDGRPRAAPRGPAAAGLTLASPVAVPHPCATRRGGCAHICVTAYRSGAAHAHCLCRHGFRLAGHGDCEREYRAVVGAPPVPP